MKILNFTAAFLYSIIMYYVVWLIFYWIIPHLMFISWGWFIAYIMVAGGAVSMFVAVLSTLLARPLVFLCKKSSASRYAPIIWALFFGYSSIKLPWRFDFDYSVLQWIIGVSLTIIIFVTFASLLYVPFKILEDK